MTRPDFAQDLERLALELAQANKAVEIAKADVAASENRLKESTARASRIEAEIQRVVGAVLKAGREKVAA